VIAKRPDIAAVAVGGTGIPLQVGELHVQAIGTTPVRGTVLPPLLEGRAPGVDEIALGTDTLRRLHARVGDRVQVRVEGTEARELTISGRGVIPPIGDTGQFGQGALIDYEVLSRFTKEAPPPDVILIRWRSGANVVAARRTIESDLPVLKDAAAEFEKPSELLNFGRVRTMQPRSRSSRWCSACRSVSRSGDGCGSSSPGGSGSSASRALHGKHWPSSFRRRSSSRTSRRSALRARPRAPFPPSS